MPCNPDVLSLIGFTLLVEKLEAFYSNVEQYRSARMGEFAQVRGVIFNSIKANVNLMSAKMRTQVRINQFKGKGVVANSMHILDTQIRDEVIVPRAVTLGLPVCLLGDPNKKNTVRDDYRAVAQEIIKDAPTVAEVEPSLVGV